MAAGIHVLEDTATQVETPGGPLWIVGVSDFWSGPHDLRTRSEQSPIRQDRSS